MIDAREVRLGNWYIQHNYNARTQKYCQVSEIRDWYFSDTEGVELTPEILEKCGFKLEPQRTSIYVKDRLKLWLGSNGVIAYLVNEDRNQSSWISNPVQSLHQLQNLYFALTGEELNIKL